MRQLAGRQRPDARERAVEAELVADHDEPGVSTDTRERFVREWLNAQAAGGYVEYDPAGGTYELPPEQAAALADETSPAFVCGAFQLATSTIKDEPRIREALNEEKLNAFVGQVVEEIGATFIPACDRDAVQPRLRGEAVGTQVVSVNVGHPRRIVMRRREVTTGISRSPSTARCASAGSIWTVTARPTSRCMAAPTRRST
jgi:hypothetical protein